LEEAEETGQERDEDPEVDLEIEEDQIVEVDQEIEIAGDMTEKIGEADQEAMIEIEGHPPDQDQDQIHVTKNKYLSTWDCESFEVLESFV